LPVYDTGNKQKLPGSGTGTFKLTAVEKSFYNRRVTANI
jgi:hypothetical protein